MKTHPQAGISGRVSASPKKRFLITLVGVIGFALIGLIGFTLMQSQEGGENKGSPTLAQNEESPQVKEEAVQGSSSKKEMVFDEKTLRALAALEKKVNKKVSKKYLKSLSKEEREALVKAREEANLVWAKCKEKYLQWLKKKNVERVKQGKEPYQEFIIPRGTATYMSFGVKIEDLNADVHDGGVPWANALPLFCARNR